MYFSSKYFIEMVHFNDFFPLGNTHFKALFITYLPLLSSGYHLHDIIRIP